jgi:elongator complex protein 3
MVNADAVREIIDALMLLPFPTPDKVGHFKLKVASRRHLKEFPSNADLIAALTPQERLKLGKVLRRKSTRGISGVTVVAVMTKPYACPQPEPCAYCPGGPSTNSPQSYTGHEPAAMRGGQNNYDPYMQVRSRINQLTAIGHVVDKIELIIMGGTFPATPAEYQQWFVQRCLDAITDKESKSLADAKVNAETSKTRNVGITVETRPDWAKREQVDSMLDMGVTRVELGVQNPDDEIYWRVGRTHTVADVQRATQIAKDAGLKVVYHMMPGMPGSTPDKDLEVFKLIFDDASFRPDMIKVYPCLVIDGTKVHKWYQQGIYVPCSTEEATNLILQVKRIIPRWVRIMRVQRDIPARLIVAGVKRSNLRQLVNQQLTEHGECCRCIRCREVGHRWIVDGVKPNLSNVKLCSSTYAASGGKEVFISAEDQENAVLIGYLRLRIPSAHAHRPEIAAVQSAIVRELHVYGQLVPVGEHSIGAWQHKGYGKILLEEAERVAREDYALKKLLVISALGTKQYYMRLGFSRDGVYVSKTLGD